jgi:hypothetical protein
MTKEEAIKQLDEDNFPYSSSLVKKDDFEGMGIMISCEPHNEADKRLINILKNYSRSHKLSLIASQP